MMLLTPGAGRAETRSPRRSRLAEIFENEP